MYSPYVFIILLPMALAASRTSAPTGSITVAKSGGDYSTIQDAVDSLSTTDTTAQSIFIEAGTYTEQVYIASRKAALTIYGSTTDDSSYSENTVIITHNASQTTEPNDDSTATVRNWAENTKFYNLNIINTFGKATTDGQALAISASAGYQGYYGCQFTSYQDTVMAETGAQVYAKSYIEGATDFIFGQTASAWFDQVDIRVPTATWGTITASGRNSASSDSYYVINNSTVAAKSGDTVPSGAYYLGRPWRPYARVVFQDTTMTDVINSAGWVEWSASISTANVTFEEYGNTGVGSEGTRDIGTKISSPLGVSTVLGSDYSSWVDTTYLS